MMFVNMFINRLLSYLDVWISFRWVNQIFNYYNNIHPFFEDVIPNSMNEVDNG